MKFWSVFVLAFLCLNAIHAGNAQAKSLIVAAGGDLQAAIDEVAPGDEIVVQAGATFVGPFTLRKKTNPDGREIVIRTSTPDDQLPPGVRVRMEDAPKMPRLIASTGSWVLNTEEAASNYRLIGLEIAPGPGYEMLNVVLLGSWTSDGRWTETSASQLPQSIVFDRMYIHGDPVKGSRRGIALNGRDIRIHNSYISDFKQTCCDSQAICGWNGPGPFVIENNYLEGAGENIMFGGGDPSIAGLVPSNIQIRNNHLSKPLRWRTNDPSYEGTNWVVKNLFELKNAKNVVFDGNLLEYNWADDQNGFAILLTPRNSNRTSPSSTVENVTITNNVVRYSTSAINILGWDNNQSSQQTKNILIKDNLFYDIGGERWGENVASTYGWGKGGWFLQLMDGTHGVVVEHNTILETKGVLVADVAIQLGSHAGERHTGFVFRNNIIRHGSMGIAGATTASGDPTLTKYFDAPVITSNVVVGGDQDLYPAGNYFPAAIDDVGFVSSSSNFRLTGNSPYKSRATDGKDMGAAAAVFDLVSLPSAPTPPPAPAPSPAPAPPAPVPAPAPPPTTSAPPPPPEPAAPARSVIAGGMTTRSSGSPMLQVGSAEIRAAVEAPSGVAIFGYRPNGVLISEAGVPVSTPRLKGRLSAEVSGSVNTGLAISNPNDSAVMVSFFFTDADGQNFGAGSFNLPAHGQIARFLDQDPFNVLRPSNGSLTFSSTLPVAAIALRGFTNERSEFLMTSLPIGEPDQNGPATTFFPQVADGGGWTTRFILTNPSDFAMSGTLTFFTAGGESREALRYSVPPRSSRQFSTGGPSAQAQVGYARLTADLSSVAPIGVAVFSFKQSGVTVSEAGVSSEPAGKAFRMYAEVGTGAAQTGVALVNSSTTEERIEFQLTRLDGTSAGLTGSLVIPARGQRALFLNQIPGFQSLSTFKGILRISSANEKDMAVVGLRGRANERGDFLITTTPPVNESAPPNTSAVFPHIVDGGGYTTEFITFSGTNTEPASGTLRLFTQAGGNLNVTLR